MKGDVLTMKRNIRIYGIAISAAAALVGCGGGGSSSSTASQTGYLIDAPVANATYDCIADGEEGKTTGADGSFTCHTMHVRFRIGNLVLGEINALPEDKLVYPQDLAGVPRENLDDPKVVEMARMIQSMDADADLSNGIQIDEQTKAAFDEEEHFDPNHVDNYLDMANVNPSHERHENDAKEHLAQTMQMMEQQHRQDQASHDQNASQEHQQEQAGNMQEHQNEVQEHQQEQAGNMQEHQNEAQEHQQEQAGNINEAQEHQQEQAGNMQEHQNEAQEHNRV